MQTSRRAFLRTLFGGTVAVAAAPLVPKGTVFSFLGSIFKRKRELWVPEPQILTLADFVRKLPPDARFASVAELLNERNTILDDIMWVEENTPTTHVTSALPGSLTLPGI